MNNFNLYNMEHKEKVICITTNKLFESVRDAGKYYKIDATNISQCCKGKRKSVGKLEDGTKMEWIYYKDNNFFCECCGKQISNEIMLNKIEYNNTPIEVCKECKTQIDAVIMDKVLEIKLYVK